MKHPVKILIVEDETTIAMMMQFNLQDMGYTVYDPVSNGLSAIEQAKKLAIDVILMDIRLSGKMDGVEAAQKIREFSDVPIIFLTGYADITSEERANSVSPLKFLRKPIDLLDIKRILESFFSEA